MTDKRPLIILVVVVALLLGGSFAFRDNPADPSATPPPPTTLATALDSTNDTFGRGPEATAPSVADWEAGLQQVTALENELFSAPDSDRIDELMLPDCPCHKETKAQLDKLADAGHRVDGANIAITHSGIVEQIGPRRVRLFVGVEPLGRPIVDSNGEVVEPSPTGAPPALIYVLEKGQDGKWRIADRHLEREDRR